MLKYENSAEIGEVIKAYDFEPMEGRPKRFIVGRVIKKGEVIHPQYGVSMFEGFHIKITGADRDDDSRIGDIGYIPFETTFDYDGRIEVIA